MGGADTVTGSQHIVEANGQKLLRDCGLFQGKRQESDKLNSEFLYKPAELNAMVLSHAHIDHCGCIPRLVANGFSGPIHTTAATRELTEIMLMDAARIQEQDAAYLNQKTNRQGKPPVVPLYTVPQAEESLKRFVVQDYHQPRELVPGITHGFFDAGHVLGSGLSVFTIEEGGRTVRLGFAVDLGRKGLPILRDPEDIGPVDALVIESTYGDRRHEDASKSTRQLGEVIQKTIGRGGKVLIPAFALERAQEIIYHLGVLWKSGAIPRIPVYVDSPMATNITRVFGRQLDLFDEESRRLLAEVRAGYGGDFVRYTASVEDSKAITGSNKPCIVIAASGMCESGRILHHLKAGISDPRNSVAIVGFQAVYTLGRRLADHEPRVRIFGDEFDVRAEVHVLKSFSAHADCDELLDYVKRIRPKSVFLVHGEAPARAAFADALRSSRFENVHLPARGDVVEI